ncbi:unnamed protein product [Prunus armeniaca]
MGNRRRGLRVCENMRIWVDGNRREARRSKAWPMVSLCEVSTDADFLDQFNLRAEISSLPKVKGKWRQKMFDAEMCERSKSLIPGLLRKKVKKG